MIEKLDQGKFIVINWKRLREIAEAGYAGEIAAGKLRRAIALFRDDYEKFTGKKMDQKYIVCNQDEPYADQVAEIILRHEENKA